MSLLRAVTAATLLAAIAAGCAFNEPAVFDQHPGIRDVLSKNPSPLPYRLAVTPLKLQFDLEKEGQEGHFTPRVRPDELTQRIVEGLRRMKIFREVLVVGEETPNAPLEDHLKSAWDVKADLLLDLNVERYEVYWVGTNGLFIPNLVWWSFVWAASGYVDDETYGGGIDINAGLYSVHSNRKIETWTIRKDVSLDLNDFERGWMLLGWLRVPGSLDEENWLKINEIVTPYTELEVQAELGKALGESFRATTGTPEFAKKMSKRLALIVGVDRWDDYRLNWVRFAGDDAKALETVLSKAEHGVSMPQKNIRTLVNEQATLKGLKEAISGFLAARATPEDLVVVYYAGYGCPSKDGKQGYLLTYDTKVDDLANTALSLADLKALLDEVKAKNVVIVLDTAFVADEAGRSAIKTVFPDAAVDMDEASLEALAGEGRLVAIASSAGEGAQLFAPKKHGMYTHFLLDGLDPEERPADGDKNGLVSLDEALNYAVAKTADETSLSVTPQTPRILGKTRGAVLLARFVEGAELAGPEDETPEGPGAEDTPEEPGMEEPAGEPGTEEAPKDPGPGEAPKDPGTEEGPEEPADGSGG